MKSNLDVKFGDPKRPNQDFHAFLQEVLHQISESMKVPYEMLIQHTEEKIAKINEK